MAVVFFHSHILVSLTMNAPMLTTIKVGVQQKWMLKENIMDSGRTAIKIARKVSVIDF